MRKIVGFVIMLLALMLPCAALAENYSIQSGEIVPDNNGGHVQAHGGCVIWDDITQKYYWYGEARKTSIRPSDTGWLWDNNERIGVSCYSSNDLYNWYYEGLALRVPNYYTGEEPMADIQPYRLIERPKVIYNENTGKYIMWMHIDTQDYGKAAAGVAVSDSPTGPFTYLGSSRPNGKMARDMTVFVDDDKKAYLYASGDNNMTMYCHRLTDDYLSFDGTYSKMFENWQREAPAVFKYKSTYYMINSGCSGWDPNKADYATASNPLGPWTSRGNPCVGANSDKTFGGQSYFVLPVDREGGKFIFMADIWRPSNHSDSRYIWLPINFNSDGTIWIEWLDEWRIENRVEETKLETPGNITLRPGEVYRTEIKAQDAVKIVSHEGAEDSLFCELEGNILTLYALKEGEHRLTVRAGGGGYDGAAQCFKVFVGESGAHAYAEEDGRLLINASDAASGSEYAFTNSASQDYHAWKGESEGLLLAPDTNGQWWDTENLCGAPKASYRVDIKNPGEYYFLAECSFDNLSGNSFHVLCDGQYLFTLTGEDNLGEGRVLSSAQWKISFPEKGCYIITIAGREDGARVNKIALSKNAADSLEGFEESGLSYAPQKTQTLSGSEKIALDMRLNKQVEKILDRDIEFVPYFGTEVSYSGCGAVSSEGKVTPDREKNTYAKMEACYTSDGEEVREIYSVVVPRADNKIISGASFETIDIRSVKDFAYVSFDVTANSLSDGMIAFCPSSVTPNDWGSYAVTFRIKPDGTFDARDGDSYAASEEVFYKTNRTYHVVLALDVKENRCSAYVTDSFGVTGTVAENFKFRYDAQEIGRLTVRGGNGTKAGLFAVDNLFVSDTFCAIDSLYVTEGAMKASVRTVGEESVTAYAAFYDDGTLVRAESAEIKGNELIFTCEKSFTDAKLMIFSKDGEPLCEAFADNVRGEDFALPEGKLLSSSQSAEAIYHLPPAKGAAHYTFILKDNASSDSGVMIGSSENLRAESRNYFADGSLVLLFANGKMYTRDKNEKTFRANYTVGEEIKIDIDADITGGLYDLYVNGVLCAEDISFRAEADMLDTLALVENKGGEMFEVTNFEIAE